MKSFILILAGCLFAAPAFAAVKPCEDLKSEIAAKLDVKGVKDYSLEIVAAGDVKDKTIVGSCDGGTKKITYDKATGPSAGNLAAAPKKGFALKLWEFRP